MLLGSSHFEELGNDLREASLTGHLGRMAMIDHIITYRGELLNSRLAQDLCLVQGADASVTGGELLSFPEIRKRPDDFAALVRSHAQEGLLGRIENPTGYRPDKPVCVALLGFDGTSPGPAIFQTVYVPSSGSTWDSMALMRIVEYERADVLGLAFIARDPGAEMNPSAARDLTNELSINRESLKCPLVGAWIIHQRRIEEIELPGNRFFSFEASG